MVQSLPSIEALRPQDILNEQIVKAHKAGYDLLTLLDTMADWTNNKVFQVATSESLTAGLIFSTLVDIPIGGSYKYGAFAVYDTDAKRVFNGVTVENVYTHKCAKEMAVGILKNSNATIAIAVTGNAMPRQNDLEDVKKVGEVYIGIAGYVRDDSNNIVIKVRTKLFNVCNESEFPGICSIWYDSVHQEKEIKSYLNSVKDPKPSPEFLDFIKRLIDGFADPELTSLMSNYIRQYTVERAFRECIDFMNTYKDKLTIPEFTQINYRDRYHYDLLHLGDTNTTNNKLLNRYTLPILCEDPIKCNLERTQTNNSQMLYAKRNKTKKRKNRNSNNNRPIVITTAKPAVNSRAFNKGASSIAVRNQLLNSQGQINSVRIPVGTNM